MTLPSVSGELQPVAESDDASGRATVIRLLEPGRRDARNLLIVWYVRRSFYPLLFLGFIGAFVTGGDTNVEWSDPNEVARDLFSPLAGLILAVVVRIGANLASLALAFPLAKRRDASLEPRTGVNKRLSRWLDLRQASRGYRALRWTHHVRQEALRRVAPGSELKWKLDQIFDVATIALLVAMFAGIFIAAWI